MTKEVIEESRKRQVAARNGMADIALIVTIIALIASLAIAAITVSIGIARADTFGVATALGGARQS